MNEMRDRNEEKLYYGNDKLSIIYRNRIIYH